MSKKALPKLFKNWIPGTGFILMISWLLNTVNSPSLSASRNLAQSPPSPSESVASALQLLEQGQDEEGAKTYQWLIGRLQSPEISPTQIEEIYREASKHPQLLERIQDIHEVLKIGVKRRAPFAPTSISHNQKVQLDYLDKILTDATSPSRFGNTPGLYFGTRKIRLSSKETLELRHLKQNIAALKAGFRERTSHLKKIIARELILQSIENQTQEWISRIEDLKEEQTTRDIERATLHQENWNLVKDLSHSTLSTIAYLKGGKTGAATVSLLFCVVEDQVLRWSLGENSRDRSNPNPSLIKMATGCVLQSAIQTAGSGATVYASRLIQESALPLLASQVSKALATGASATVISQITGISSGVTECTLAQENFPTLAEVGAIAQTQIEHELSRYTTAQGLTSLIAEAWLSHKVFQIHRQEQARHSGHDSSQTHSSLPSRGQVIPILGRTPSTGDNHQFISLMQNPNLIRQQKLRFFEVENSVLKALNDKVFKSKDISEILENRWRSILLRHLKSDPTLIRQVRAQYEDYKSFRYAFEVHPELESRFAQAYERATQEFKTQLENSEYAKTYQSFSGSLADPARWHMAGVGNTPDEAGATCRYARTLNSGDEVSLRSFEHALPWIRTQAVQAEVLRKKWIKSLSKEEKQVLLQKELGTPAVPVDGAFELIRKVDFANFEAGIEDLGKRITKRFGVQLTSEQLRVFHAYSKSVDSFSAGVLIPERQSNDLSPAQNGIISADFAGQGGRNLGETALALARTSSAAKKADTQAIIVESREALRRASERMYLLNDHYREALQRTVGKEAVKRLTFSGDDGIFLPEADWKRKDRLNLLSHLIEISPNPSQFRLTWVPTTYPDGSTIPAAIRSRLVNQAESVEKNVRSHLESHLPRKTLQGTTILIEFRPSSPRSMESGEYSVLIGVQSELSAKANLQTTTQKLLRHALDELAGDSPRETLILGETLVTEERSQTVSLPQ